MNIKINYTGDAPIYATPGAAGADLLAPQEFSIEPNQQILIELNLSLEIPAGYEGQIRGRSGLTIKKGIVATLGTIDSDYRGRLGVHLTNTSDCRYDFQKGDRIAQLVIAPVVQAEFVRVEELSDTSRGGGGYGSTGVK